MPDPSVDVAIDISNCETELLRFPGAVQPHGAVLVLQARTAMIEAASESCEALLGHLAERLPGRALHDVIDSASAAALQEDHGSRLEPLVHVVVNGRDLRARSSINQAQQVVIDFESAGDEWLQGTGTPYHRRRVLTELRRLSDISLVAHEAAALVRGITGFDRVMIYRFDPVWNGEVIGEACADHVEPYLGLHFPASDIPKQARELFASGRIRFIPDVGYVPSALVTRVDGGAIDLGSSGLRSVSPSHLEYLTNMQVHATLVGSLHVEGRLWGLVSCQHKSGPMHVAPFVRDAVEWLCEDLAAMFESTVIRLRGEREFSLSQRRRRLVDSLRGADPKDLMSGRSADLLEVVDADGFALLTGDSIHVMGATPSPDQISLLQQRRRERESSSTFFDSSALARDLGVTDTGGSAGALFVSLDSGADVSMIWFRNELRTRLRWGGDPECMRVVDESGRFSPRKSFAQFVQEVNGQCLPWSPEELASAAELRSLIEIEALRESEAFAKSILNSSPQQTAVLDARGVIVSVNHAWEQIGATDVSRYGAAGSVGLRYSIASVAAVGSPDEADAVRGMAGIEAVLQRVQDHFTLDYPCVLLQATRWIRLTVYRMIAPGEGAVVVHEDITERKLTEHRLEYERTQLRTLLQTIPDMVWLKDPQGVYLTCNAAFQRLMRATQSDILGKTDYDFLPAALADSIRRVHLDAAASDHALIGEVEGHSDAAGRPILLEVTRTAMRDSHGTLLGVLAVGRDITERRRQEGELEQHRHHLERLVDERTAELAKAHAAAEAEHRAAAERLLAENEEKMRSAKLQAVGTLAAGIAHDFNNILAAIVGFAEMTADDLPDDSIAKHNVAQILSGSFRGRDLVARMLTFARASPIEPTAVDIADEVEEALALLRASVRPSIELIFDDRLADGNASVLAEPTKIMQIVMNLCINSSHAIENHGTISVGLESASKLEHAPPQLLDGICLTVTDTGSGMTAEVRERLFDPFFTTKAPGEGSGLGLSVVYGIVSAMGGTIEVHSSTAEVDRGTRFQLFFPRFVALSGSSKRVAHVS